MWMNLENAALSKSGQTCKGPGAGAHCGQRAGKQVLEGGEGAGATWTPLWGDGQAQEGLRRQRRPDWHVDTIAWLLTEDRL